MLPFIHFKNLDGISNITHGFFTREGGVSTGELASANFVRRPQETDENLAENHKRLLMSFNGSIDFLALPFQKHGTNVITVTKDQKPGPNGLPASMGEGDALISDVPGVAVGVITADCMPILISDKEGTVVAAIHAGWRGTLEGVIQATMEKLRTMRPQAEFIAGIGPCLQQQNFEFGEDLMKEFSQKYSIAQGYFLRLQGKYYFNLEGFARWLLAELGVKNLHSDGIDTYSNASKYFSCRRSNHWGDAVFGTQVSAIGLKRPSK